MYIFFTALVVVGVGVCVYVFSSGGSIGQEDDDSVKDSTEVAKSQQSQIRKTRAESVASRGIPRAEVVTKNLEVPWGIAFLPSGDMLVTERPGTLLRIDPKTGKRRATIPLPETASPGEAGLLGIALHPKFKENRYLYLYQTTKTENGTTNRVVRYEFRENDLRNPEVIIDGIPGAIYHDGGRIKFGPPSTSSGQVKRKLYITTGDATNGYLAQDKNSLAGKILRLNPDGSVPDDNPFGNAVWSYGHRNPQGITWDSEGRLWATEHGRSGLRSGFDEINLIKKGKNYGWPYFEGDEASLEITEPVLHSTSEVTWAPASVAYLDGSLYFGALYGQALYEAVLKGDEVIRLDRYFYEKFGRIRTVAVGPDGFLYLSTSNTDGRGDPLSGDDKIIRVNPKKL